MKKTITLSIPTGCTEKWENFSTTSIGGFCSTCTREVIDFSNKSDSEIIDFFLHKPAHTCGRFRADQLKTYEYTKPAVVRPGLKLLQAGFMCLLVALVSKPTLAQIKSTPTQTSVKHSIRNSETAIEKKSGIVSGVVTSKEDGLPLPGVNVVLRGTMLGTSTDAQGKFQFPEKLIEGDVLVFSFIGLEGREYTIPAAQIDAQVAMAMDVKMELCSVVMLGEVAVDGIYNQPSRVQRLLSRVRSIF